MQLNEYINNGIKNLAASLSKFYLTNIKGIKFLKVFMPELKKSMERRRALEASGRHVPPFLIASIASSCNLNCKGCYARAGDTALCTGHMGDNLDGAIAGNTSELSGEEWGQVFDEAADMGVSFVLLAGGEPLLRRDVIQKAARCRSMAFPIFTNGTLLDERYIDMFVHNLNIFPVFSLEGDEKNTDERRGKGVFQSVDDSMTELRRRRVLFGASITVNSENISEVTSDEFLKGLHGKGCGIIFYVEYVPVQEGTEGLMLSKEQSARLLERGEALKQLYSDMSVLMFPGDEKYMGGCLAAGRGFFHINPRGGAEACPFAPYSKWTVRDHSLLEIVNSEFFEKVREVEKKGVDDHRGGCTLFNYRKEVTQLAE